MPRDDELLEAARAVLAESAARGSTITYDALVERLPALEPLRRSGRLGQLLRRITLEEAAMGRGMLSVVVVRTRDGALPGAGFFRLAEELGRDVSDRTECWRAELARVVAEHQPGSRDGGR